MEKSNKIERSEAWNNIYEVLARLDLKESTDDCLDRPSAATELEQLFLKLLPVQNVRVSTWENASESDKLPFIEKAIELTQDTMFCTRIWSAWGYGTMTEDDFLDATGESEFIDAIAEAIWQGY